MLARAALALAMEGSPLGLTHLSVWARDPASNGKTRDMDARSADPAEVKEGQQ